MSEESLVTITVQFSGADQNITDKVVKTITEDIKSKTKDLNLISHIDIKNMPLIVQGDEFDEVPTDIRSYLVKHPE